MVDTNSCSKQRELYHSKDPHRQILCAVCDDSASGRHYGVFTCEGCKCFFSRVQRQKLSLKCEVRGCCIVNKRLRKHCKACRFEKCCVVGMRREAIKKGRPPKNSYTSRAANMKRFRSYNLLTQLMDEIEQEVVESSTKMHLVIQHSDTATQNFQLETTEVKAKFERKKMKQSSELDESHRLAIPASMYDYKQTLKQTFVGSQSLGRYGGPLSYLAVMSPGGLNFKAHSISSIYSPLALSSPCLFPNACTMSPMYRYTAASEAGLTELEG